MPAYKDEERGTWMARFYYKDFSGKSIPKKKRGFRLKSEALEYERKFKEKYEGSSNMGYDSLYEVYMEMVKPKIKVTTYINKKSLLENHVLPYFKDTKINDIQPINIMEWQNKMRDKDLAKATLDNIQRHFSATMNFAVKHLNLPNNPIKTAGPMGGKKTVKDAFWTLDEFNQAMQYFPDGEPLRLIYNILFYSGLRLGELQALTLADIDFKGLTLTVNKTYLRYRKRHVITEPKTPSSNRTVTMPKEIMDSVEAYANRLFGLRPSDRLFAYYSVHDIRSGLKKAAKKMKVEQINVHDLRHSHASLLVNLNTPVKAVSQRLGHTNIAITLNLYSHLYPNEQRDIADGLNQLINIGPKHAHDTLDNPPKA